MFHLFKFLILLKLYTLNLFYFIIIKLPPLIFLRSKKRESIEFLDIMKGFNPIKKLNKIIIFIKVNNLR